MSELYNNLMEALLEVREIRAGRADPVEVIEIPESPKAIRKKLNLSQVEFADFVGVNEYTLKNWEQGKRKVPRTAQMLFKIAAYRPDVILEMRQRDIKAAKQAARATRSTTRKSARRRLAKA